MNKALILDLDDTVRTCNDPSKKCPNNLGEQQILPNRVPIMQAYRNDGYVIIGVTNQGGVGQGYISPAVCKSISEETNNLCNRLFDKIYEAMASPEEKDFNTKPNPGMILQAHREFRIDLIRSIMVGDQETDMQAAHSAGVGEFYYPKDFFGC